MKINYLILENFSNIETAMGVNKIKIDFTNAENKVILLVGPNGCGKTSILSMLTPFANVGGLDVRNSTYPIIEGKNGYKEIQITNGEDVYTIKHFYTVRKEVHSVKSYIEKNGEELNPNGNVSSFKDWVKLELHVEPDYLKLIRLGANVTSMISMTEGERKNFMNKLLEDADIFLAFFKKVNSDLRQLKDMISHTIDKQNRLGIVSIDSVSESIDNLNSQREMRQSEYQDVVSRISVLQYNLDMIENGSELRNKLSDGQRRLAKMEKILEKKDYESTSPEYYSSKINELELENSSMEATNQATESSIQTYLSQLDSLNESYRKLEIQYKKEKESATELLRMESEISNLNDDIEQMEKSLPENIPDIQKKDLEDFVVFLKTVHDRISVAYEFGRPVIHRIVQLLKKGKNVSSYINNNMMNLSNLDNADRFLENLRRQYSFTESALPTGCAETCIARQVYIDIANLINRDNDSAVRYDMEILESMKSAYQIISQILVDFSTYDGIIRALPKEYQQEFLLESVYNKMDSLSPIYDFHKMDSLLSTVTEVHVIEELKKQRDEQMELYKKFSKFSNFGFLEEQLKSTYESIEDLESEIRELRESIYSNMEKLKENNRSIDVYRDLFETFSDHDTLVEDVVRMEKEWKVYSENTKEIREELNHLEVLKKQIKEIQDMIDVLKQKMTQYITISSELRTYKKVYDEMIYVKESLSSTKGIPLRYIKNYLGNIEEIANNLLDIAFNGTIYLDKFRITQSEFSIPFYNRGRLLSDVKLASQGESAFISIALSFALSAQTMQEYNIMLLDEIDSALDTKHREKFLAILENQMNRMNTEQCFFITHGDMFSSYPVDIISIVPNEEYEGTIEIQKI